MSTYTKLDIFTRLLLRFMNNSRYLMVLFQVILCMLVAPVVLVTSQAYLFSLLLRLDSSGVACSTRFSCSKKISWECGGHLQPPLHEIPVLVQTKVVKISSISMNPIYIYVYIYIYLYIYIYINIYNVYIYIYIYIYIYTTYYMIQRMT